MVRRHVDNVKIRGSIPFGPIFIVSIMADKNGITLLHTALIIYLIGIILNAAASLTIGAYGFLFGLSVYGSYSLTTFTSQLGLVLSVIALFFMRKGFKALQLGKAWYNIGAQGATVQMPGVVLILIGTAITASILSASAGAGISTAANNLSLAGIGITFLGYALYFLGSILVAVGFSRLGADNSNGILKAGGVLYVIFNFLGVLLLLSGIHGLVKRGVKGKN